ncbi:MAG: His/Gly/Thr/Pro-type tRNA ligase C-terminal domain-containing protein, partial [Candidatus Woesearchaeota archaeon]
NEKMSQKARELTQKLRLKWSAETDLLRRKLSKQLEYAASIGATKVVIVGPEELKKGKVVVRDMASGKEEEVSIDELLKYNIVKLN